MPDSQAQVSHPRSEHGVVDGEVPVRTHISNHRSFAPRATVVFKLVEPVRDRVEDGIDLDDIQRHCTLCRVANDIDRWVARVLPRGNEYGPHAQSARLPTAECPAVLNAEQFLGHEVDECTYCAAARCIAQAAGPGPDRDVEVASNGFPIIQLAWLRRDPLNLEGQPHAETVVGIQRLHCKAQGGIMEIDRAVGKHSGCHGSCMV